MYRLEGELFGDPDFCTFKIIGGSDNGLPGPGQTTLTKLPSGDFAVDSFFDITYQIEFDGCPGSQLADYSGTTTATIRMQTGRDPVPPSCLGGCPDGGTCEETITNDTDRTIDICCDCIFEPVVCEPTDDGLACKDADCPDPNHTCLPKVVRHNIPPRYFPPAGLDILPSTGGSIKLQHPDGFVQTIPILSDAPVNNTIVSRGDPISMAGRGAVVETEMVALNLTGQGGIIVRLNPNPDMRSFGHVLGSDDPYSGFPADSFFDVFVEVDIPLLGTLSNQEPIPLDSLGITNIPPLGSTFETPDSWPGAMLFDQNGRTTGFVITRVEHTLPPPPPQWEVLECECMEHEPDHTFTVDDGDCPNCADLNCDGIVDFLDAAIMGWQWLQSCE